jgi:hypothetical protein
MTYLLEADEFCLLLSEFPGFPMFSTDFISTMPLSCMYSINKFFVTTVLEPTINKHVSLIIRGLFQPFSLRRKISVFISDVVFPTSEIHIGTILIEKPASCETCIYLMGIVATLSKSQGFYNIAFNDGSVSYFSKVPLDFLNSLIRISNNPFFRQGTMASVSRTYFAFLFMLLSTQVQVC